MMEMSFARKRKVQSKVQSCNQKYDYRFPISASLDAKYRITMKSTLIKKIKKCNCICETVERTLKT